MMREFFDEGQFTYEKLCVGLRDDPFEVLRLERNREVREYPVRCGKRHRIAR